MTAYRKLVTTMLAVCLLFAWVSAVKAETVTVPPVFDTGMVSEVSRFSTDYKITLGSTGDFLITLNNLGEFIFDDETIRPFKRLSLFVFSGDGAGATPLDSLALRRDDPTGTISLSGLVGDIFTLTVTGRPSSISGGPGRLSYYQLSVAPVPLPAGLLLLGSALTGLVTIRRRVA
jgi:hypothetical protein